MLSCRALSSCHQQAIGPFCRSDFDSGPSTQPQQRAPVEIACSQTNTSADHTNHPTRPVTKLACHVVTWLRQLRTKQQNHRCMCKLTLRIRGRDMAWSEWKPRKIVTVENQHDPLPLEPQRRRLSVVQSVTKTCHCNDEATAMTEASISRFSVLPPSRQRESRESVRGVSSLGFDFRRFSSEGPSKATTSRFRFEPFALCLCELIVLVADPRAPLQQSLNRKRLPHPSRRCSS